jgi:hypothetical protein
MGYSKAKILKSSYKKSKEFLLKDQPKAKESTTLKTKKIMQRGSPTNSK